MSNLGKEPKQKPVAMAAKVITDCQDLLAAWIVPDSGITDQTVLNDLLGILDGPQARKALTAQDNAKARLQDVCEIYNGMDGFEPKTAPEDYLLRIVRQMYHAALGEVTQD